MLNPNEYADYNIKRLNQYCDDVLNDRINCGKYEKKTVEYFNRLKEKYIYKESELRKVLKFFSLLNIPTVSKGVIQAELPAYQLVWLAAEFALYQTEKDRLINFCYYNVAKKNSKSTYEALTGIYATVFDGQPQAEVVIAANSLSQAKIIIKYAGDILKCSPLVRDYFEVYKSSLINKSSTGFNRMFAITSEGSTTQGMNPSRSTVDEYAFAKSADILSKLNTGAIARQNKCQVVITTAGDNKQVPCYELHQLCSNILDGIVEQDNTFCAVYCFDNDNEADLIDTDFSIVRKPLGLPTQQIEKFIINHRMSLPKTHASSGKPSTFVCSKTQMVIRNL